MRRVIRLLDRLVRSVPLAALLALAAPNVVRQLNGASPKKVIVVPDRLVNLVA